MPININKKFLFNEFFNKSEAPRKIEHLVLHHIAAETVQKAIDELKKHQVSAHYIIDREGEIFQLVEENDIAHHAGVSHWRSVEGLNKSSIGIEFFNPDPLEKRFTTPQIAAGITLCQELIEKYQIPQVNVVGHCDIAYYPDDEENKSKKISGFLDRKQDPSHLFPWRKFSEHNVGIYPKNVIESKKDPVLFKLGDSDPKISDIKYKLHSFGYRISKYDILFDEELAFLVRAFHRHYNQKIIRDNLGDHWFASSDLILMKLSC